MAPCLLGIYRGLYYPVMWGLNFPRFRFQMALVQPNPSEKRSSKPPPSSQSLEICICIYLNETFLNIIIFLNPWRPPRNSVTPKRRCQCYPKNQPGSQVTSGDWRSPRILGKNKVKPLVFGGSQLILRVDDLVLR